MYTDLVLYAPTPYDTFSSLTIILRDQFPMLRIREPSRDRGIRQDG